MSPKSAPESQRVEVAKEWIAFRHDHMMTQQELANALGISRRSVNYIEAAQKYPGPLTQGMMRALVARVGKKE